MEQPLKILTPGSNRSAAPAAETAALTVAAWEAILAHLVDLTRARCEGDQVHHAAALAARAADEPMARMVAAARELGLQVAPTRMPIAEAVWVADARTPVIVWCAPENRWIVIRRFGALRARISTGEAPLELEPMSRTALARRLGRQSADDVIEMAFVYAPDLVPPAADLQDGHGHGHGHGHAVSPVRRYLAIIRPETPEIFAITSFSIVTGLLYLALPLAVNAFVSNVSFGNQAAPFIQALLFLGLALFGALALSATIRALQVYAAEVIKRRLFVRLMADLTHRLSHVKGLSLQGAHAPELVNRFLDIVTLQSTTERLLMSGIPVVLGIVIGTIVLGLYHPTLFAFAIGLWMVLGLAVLAGRGAVNAAVDESRLKYEAVGWLEELARTPTLFKSAGGFALAEQRSDLIARRYLGARKRFFFILMRQIGTFLLLEIFATAALLIVGGWLVLEQQLTLGQLVASELIVTSITYSLSKLGTLFDSWYSGLAAIDKISHLTDLETERIDGDFVESRGQGMTVECRDVHFAYPSGRAVLKGLNLSLQPSECVALWGLHGRGSSTVLNVLFGLVPPDRGAVTIDGLDIRHWNLERLRSRTCLIRGADLVAGSILENVRLGRDDIGLDAVSRALEDVGLLEDVLSMPDGVHTQLISGGLPLSSRERLRLLVARAIVLNPDLLLLDDVLDGIDPDTLNELFAVLLDRKRGWTVLVATRDPSVAEQCHRYIEIDADGSCGSHDAQRSQGAGA
jgi:ABC-type bacteriocin/lantibiotic exporter with double-glycine peptidase domain